MPGLNVAEERFVEGYVGHRAARRFVCERPKSQPTPSVEPGSFTATMYAELVPPAIRTDQLAQPLRFERVPSGELKPKQTSLEVMISIVMADRRQAAIDA